MKVRYYCRTDRGTIFKIQEITLLQNDGIWFKSRVKDNGVIKTIPSYDGLYYTESEKVIKSSPNIIDLIEVGDYVNGHKVIDIAYAPKIAVYIEDATNKMAHIPYTNNDIKSIVTKEQFEAMQYNLESEVN